MRLTATVLLAFAWILVPDATPLPAADQPLAKPASPLRLIPEQAGFVVQAEEPSKLVALANQLYDLKELRSLKVYRDFFDSTNFRRFLQIVAHFEKRLGKEWPELVDQLAGGGVALGLEFKENPTPAYAVLQGKDAKLTQRFVKELWEIILQELARQESKEAAKTDEYHGIAVYRIGDQFFAGSVDAVIAFSNSEAGLHAMLDLHRGKSEGKSLAQLPQIAEGRKLFDQPPLAWAWLNMESARKNQGVADTLALPAGADIAFLHFVGGGFLDILCRTPYLVAGLTMDGKEPMLSLRAPRGHEGHNPAIDCHVPPLGKNNSLPLIVPKRMLAAGTFYFDAPALWEQRAKLLKGDDLKAFEDFNKKSSEFLFGRTMSQLLGYLGARHRFVVTPPAESGYQFKPTTRLPSFALILELKDPENFMKAAEPALRSLALVAGFGAEMKIAEEKEGERKIVGYRFTENEKNKAIGQGLLFNFSPCFVRVGEYFVVASNFELAHELVPLLLQQQEAKHLNDTASSRVRFSWNGLSDYLETIRDTLVTGQILGDGASPEHAKKEIDALLQLLRRLGEVEMTSEYEKDRFRIDVRVKGLFK